ncbi:MAG: transcription elongation factor GreA [bacterium]|nr:transcription elongation factor GreA [bacterium]
MANKPTYMSDEALEKLKEELNSLKTVKRREIAQKIHEAKEQGDLSENAEYQEAKDEQAWVEGRILEIESILKNVVTFQKQPGQQTVTIGSTVIIVSDAGEKTFEIVGTQEVNAALGKISNESPLGLALLGKRVGDVVTVRTPNGTREYTIKNLS